MNTYTMFEVLEAPTRPTEAGRHIFTTPILEQAVKGAQRARKQGKTYIIKGIKANGEKVIFL